MTREAEASKARMFATKGNDSMNYFAQHKELDLGLINSDPQYSTLVDESYLVIGSHLDSNLKGKIVNNEYVDFARLLLHDRQVDDNRMEIINRGS